MVWSGLQPSCVIHAEANAVTDQAKILFHILINYPAKDTFAPKEPNVNRAPQRTDCVCPESVSVCKREVKEFYFTKYSAFGQVCIYIQQKGFLNIYWSEKKSEKQEKEQNLIKNKNQRSSDKYI